MLHYSAKLTPIFLSLKRKIPFFCCNCLAFFCAFFRSFSTFFGSFMLEIEFQIGKCERDLVKFSSVNTSTGRACIFPFQIPFYIEKKSEKSAENSNILDDICIYLHSIGKKMQKNKRNRMVK